MNIESTNAVKKSKGDVKHTTPVLIVSIGGFVMAIIAMIVAISCGQEAERLKGSMYAVLRYTDIEMYEAISITMWIGMVVIIAVSIGALVYYSKLRKRFESISIVCYSDYVKVCLYDYTTKSLENKEWKYSDIKTVNYINKICSIVTDKPYALPVEDAEGITKFLQKKING